MARTATGSATHRKRAANSSAAANGIAPAAEAPALPKNAFKLTDPRGACAYVWWGERGPVVEAEDTALRRRILRAVNTPILTVEDEADESGVQWSKRLRLQPDDALYPSRWFWSLGQVGLDEIEIQVVRRESRQPVGRAWRFSDGAD